MIKQLAFVLAASTLSFTAAKAQVYSDRSTPDQLSVAVRYDDLNLTGASGADVLRKRIRTAVELVCPQPRDAKDLSRYAFYRKCVAQAEASAGAQAERAIAQSRSIHLARGGFAQR